MQMISVIIPVYNTEKYLKRCLDSALNQTYNDFEIICVNDGSFDNSLNILNEYKNKDSRIKVINQKQQGVSASRNNAIKISKGDFLFFLDSDDWIEPDCLEILYKAAKRTNADIIFGATNLYKDDFLEYCDLDKIKNNSDYRNFADNIIVIRGRLYKKSFIASNEIKFPENIKMGEDEYFNYMSLFKGAKFKAVNRALYNYQNFRKDSATSNYINCTDYDVFKEITDNESYKKTSNENKIIYLNAFMTSQIMWFYKFEQDYKLHKMIKDIYAKLIKDYSGNLLKSCESFRKFKHIAKLRYKPKTLIRKFVSLASWVSLIKNHTSLGRMIKRKEAVNKTSDFEINAISKPKISVVIPVYNTQQYLRKCLDSVLNQSLEDIEILCIDDGSNDESKNILKEYLSKDERITIINQNNLGAGSARNKGLNYAQGEYIHFLDSDDWIKEGAYEKLYKIATENKADIVKFKSYLYDDNSKKLNTDDYTNINWVEKRCFNSFITLEDDCENIVKLPDSPWSGLYNLKFLKDNKIFFDNFKCANDVGFFYRSVIKAKKVYLSDIRAIYYRIGRKDSLISKRAENFDCQIALYDAIKKESKSLPSKYRYIINNQIINATFNWYEKCLKEYQMKKETQKKISNEMNGFLNKISHAELNEENKNFYEKFRKKSFNIEINNKTSCIVITLFKKQFKIKSKKLMLKHIEKMLISQEEKINRLENYILENNFANIFNDSIRNCPWLKDSSFTLSSAAANYSFMLILFKILDEIKPKNILEMGLGQTSKLTVQYANNFKDTNLDIIENNQEWIDYFIQKISFKNNTKIHQRNLENFQLYGTNSDKYQNLNEAVSDKKYDLIIIDGPCGYGKKYPRTNILDLIPDNLSQNFAIILDDAEREGEKNSAKLIFEKLQAHDIEYLTSYKKGLKQQLLITSTNYKFIHWL